MTLAERQVLTVVEAGKVLGIGRSAAYEAARRGDIPTLRIGRRVVVPAKALERLLEGGMAVGQPDDGPGSNKNRPRPGLRSRERFEEGSLVPL